MLDQWNTSKSDFDSRTSHLARFLSFCVMFNTPRTASWPLQIVIQDPSRYSLSSGDGPYDSKKIPMHSVVFPSSLVYRSWPVPYSLCWSFGLLLHLNTPDLLVIASVSSVYHLFGLGRDSISNDSRCCSRVSSPSILVSFKHAAWNGYFLSNLKFSSVTIRAKVCTNRLNWWQKPRNVLNSVTFVVCCSPQLSSVAFVDILSLPV